MKAWKVLRHVLVKRAPYGDSSLFRLVPFGVNHNSIQAALADAFKLKLGGFAERQIAFLSKLDSAPVK